MKSERGFIGIISVLVVVGIVVFLGWGKFYKKDEDRQNQVERSQDAVLDAQNAADALHNTNADIQIELNR